MIPRCSFQQLGIIYPSANRRASSSPLSPHPDTHLHKHRTLCPALAHSPGIPQPPRVRRRASQLCGIRGLSLRTASGSSCDTPASRSSERSGSDRSRTAADHFHSERVGRSQKGPNSPTVSLSSAAAASVDTSPPPTPLFRRYPLTTDHHELIPICDG